MREDRKRIASVRFAMSAFGFVKKEADSQFAPPALYLPSLSVLVKLRHSSSDPVELRIPRAPTTSCNTVCQIPTHTENSFVVKPFYSEHQRSLPSCHRKPNAPECF